MWIPRPVLCPLCCPFLVLFFFLLQHLSALLVRPFSCSYVNYCLSARCPLSFASSFSSSSSFSFSTVTFHYTSVFFSAHTHTHTCTLYTLVPFRILLHILPLLFLPSFACLSLLLKEAKRAGTEQSLRRIKVATLLLCFSSTPYTSLPSPSHSPIRGNLIVLHTFRGYRFPAVAPLVIIMPQPSSSHSHYK